MTNNFTFGGILFLAIVFGGVSSMMTSRQSSAFEEKKTIPFKIDDSTADEDGSKLINHGNDESVCQPENKGGDELIRPSAPHPKVLRRPLRSTLKALKEFNCRWLKAWRSRPRWVEFKIVERQALK
jgi:hypothetical protein